MRESQIIRSPGSGVYLDQARHVRHMFVTLQCWSVRLKPVLLVLVPKAWQFQLSSSSVIIIIIIVIVTVTVTVTVTATITMIAIIIIVTSVVCLIYNYIMLLSVSVFYGTSDIFAATGYCMASTAMDLTVEPGLPWESVQVTILQSNERKWGKPVILCDGTTWTKYTCILCVC